MGSRTGLAAAVAASIALGLGTAAPAAVGPAGRLAGSLKRSMQSYYDRMSPGLEIASVACALNADETRGACSARFALRGGAISGVFGLAITVDRSTGEVTTKTVSERCRNTATGDRVAC